MQRPQKLKTAYKKARALTPLHTGGPVALTSSGDKIITVVGDEARLTHVPTGETICTFRGDTSGVTSLCISPNGRHVCIFYTSLALRVYELPSAPPAASASGNSSRPPAVNPVRSIARAHDAPVHVSTIDPTSTLLASGSADGVVKVWDILQGYVTHNFRGHGGVVSALRFNFPSLPSAGGEEEEEEGRVMQLITGSVDTRVRVFDLRASSRTSDATGGAGGKKAHEVLEAHVSAVRGLDVSADGRWLVSGGRDGVALIWDISGTHSHSTTSSPTKSKKRKRAAAELVKTIPLGGACEAAGIVLSDQEVKGEGTAKEKGGRLRFWVAVAGSEGAAAAAGGVSIWDASEGRKLLELGDGGGGEDREVVDALYVPKISSIVSVHADQNIVFHSLSSGRATRQLVGYNDSIVDAVFLSPLSSSSSTTTNGLDSVGEGNMDTHLAIATNSSLIRVYSTRTNDARLLSGHGDMVLALTRSADGRLLASAGKDKSARIWALSTSSASSADEQEGGRGEEWRCIALCEGHAESVGALALSRTLPAPGQGPANFMITGSQDRTLKLWDLSPLRPDSSGHHPSDPIKPKSLTTIKAHEKDINALDISPNDKLLASASQDKTIKIYEIEYTAPTSTGKSKGKQLGATGELKLVGTLKGHKRGVWTVRFGRNDRVLASGSGDKTIRLWSLDDFSCLKTFEGHTNSVLRVDFLSAGMQLVSTASDGLVKLWNVKEEECIASLDNHDDRVWALAVSQDESTIVSAGADSVITFWADNTLEQELEAEQARTHQVAQEQDFLNYVTLKDYRSAILLALAMDQPKRLLNLFQTVCASRAEGNRSLTGSLEVDRVLKTLGAGELVRLMRHVRDWNATARTSPIAQLILHAILKLRTAEDIAAAFASQLHSAPIEEADDEEDEEGERRRPRKPELSLRELVDGLLPYTERHYARAERLVQDSYVVDHVLGQMDDWLFDEADVMVA